MSNVAGNQNAVLVRTSRGNDKQGGPFIQKTWEGTENACIGAAAEIIGSDYYIIEPVGGGKFSLTARWSTNTGEEGIPEPPVREERLRFNEVQKSIYSSPAFSSLTTSQISAVRAAVESSDGAAFSVPLQQTLYDLIVVGIDSYPVYQPTVIVTDTAGSGYSWDIGFTNYGYTFSTANMIADAALTSGWQDNLPAETSSDSAFIYGWLKKPPEIVTVAGNRTQLVQEYVYGYWAVAVLPEA